VSQPTPSALPRWYRALSQARIVAGVPPEVLSVCHDSRAVPPGAAFVAVPGLTVDGHAFIVQAVERGAAAVVVQEDRRAAWPEVPDGIAVVAVPDTRVALAEAAAAFHGFPARTLGVVGVTGTDGKTTTTHLIAHVLNANGRACGYLSSVEFSAGGIAELNASHMTTLEATEVQYRLAQMRGAGYSYAAVEASSIGLEAHRVDQCEFDVGVFTNLTPDHLDYHGTMEAYLDAKAILFRMLGESKDKGFPKGAVLNADDPSSERLAAVCTVPVLTYAIEAAASVRGRDITSDADGGSFAVSHGGLEVRARTRLLGAYNVANCLAAVGVALSQGVDLAGAVDSLATFAGVPGRMERIDEGQPFDVIVDIASTAEAMRSVLSVLRPATPGRLIVVFGAAGERDLARRSGIAAAVAHAADFAVIANEDPRSEDPDAIIDDIARALVAGGFEEGRQFARRPDRREAIALAFDRARAGDLVLLAGKGTEQSIVIGTTHDPWDERQVARELLRGGDAV
jgi:UDP-N-acetylmuramoyl-L-alanyl-D-glutamate--2,6-diaminopimelate ligase